MAVSPNVLAGLAAALGGGMKAFNQRDQELEQKRQFAEQQGHQQRLLQRALSRDELDEDKMVRDEENDQRDWALKLGMNFGGQKLPESTVGGLPQNLRDLVSKPAQQQLASTELFGVTGAGGPQTGAITQQKHEAVGPGMVEINMPESERARIAQANQLAALQRAQLMAGGRDASREQQNTQFLQKLAQDRELGQQRIETMMAGIGAQNNRWANTPFVVEDMDPATGQKIRRIVGQGEAPGQTSRVAPTPQAIGAGTELETYVGKIDQALKLGDSSGWSGTGVVEGRLAGALGGKFASEDALKLRGLISDLFAENAHERFGGALTKQEIDRAKGYLAEVTDDPKKIRVNLMQMRSVVMPALGRWRARGIGSPSGQPAGSAPAPASPTSKRERYDPTTGSFIPVP